MSHETDLQNQIIMERLAKTQLAVNVLHSHGLSVLNITGIGIRPEIYIQRGPGCAHLPGAWQRRIIRDGQKIYEWIASIADCRVIWEERK